MQLVLVSASIFCALLAPVILTEPGKQNDVQPGGKFEPIRKLNKVITNGYKSVGKVANYVTQWAPVVKSNDGGFYAGVHGPDDMKVSAGHMKNDGDKYEAKVEHPGPQRLLNGLFRRMA